MYNCCHCLRGQCGLKSVALGVTLPFPLSLPARAVWIEIYVIVFWYGIFIVTACEGSVD